MEGQEIVTSDDQKLGNVIAERDDCVVVETGHVFKTKHAIPKSFLHEHDGVLRATVPKDVVTDSPKVDPDNWDCGEVHRHYGLETQFVTDPDPDGVESAETVGLREGVEPAPSARVGTLGGANDPAVERPAVFDRPANPADPTGVTASTNVRKPRPPEE
jgi:hypothetical protein